MTPLLTGVFASQISGHLDTFTPSSSYDALASYTVPGTGVTTITFAGLPTSGYKHLQIRANFVLASSANDFYNQPIWFNGDNNSGKYNNHYLRTYSNNTISSGSSLSQNTFFVNDCAATQYSYESGISIIDVLDYNSTVKYKTVRAMSGINRNNQTGATSLNSASYMSLDPITSISFLADAGLNYSTRTKISVYGIKG